MHEIYELKEKLMDELAAYAKNGKFSEDDAKNIKNLSGAIDHICNILMEDEGEEYSGRYDGGMMSYQRGGQGGNQGGGSSNRGGSYNRGSYDGGSYARGRGRNAKRDSMGRYSSERGYSRNDEMQEMADSIRDMMVDLPQEVQRDAQKFVQKLEQHMM